MQKVYEEVNLEHGKNFFFFIINVVLQRFIYTV